MRKPLYCQRKAFTLIELLAVIAVVAILATIILGAIGKAREKAMLASCSSNLRQIAMAMMLHSTDNEGKFPMATEVITGVGRIPWSQKLFDQGYISDPRVFSCPGDTLNTMEPDPARGLPRAASYAYCMPIMGWSGSGADGSPSYSQNSSLRPANLDDPSRYYMLNEFHKPTGNWTTPHMIISLDTTRDHVSESHPNGGRNMIFVDGHVEWRTLEQLNRPEGWRLR